MELPQALSEDQVARMLGITSSALRRWRRDGAGPRFRKLGRAVRYMLTDVEAFIEACAVSTERSGKAR